MWRTVDPEGRFVVLTEARWRHIPDDHPDLARSRSMILTAVAMPDEWLRGRAAGEEWFYRETTGSVPWLKVVVHYEADQGLIVTAFPRRWFP